MKLFSKRYKFTNKKISRGGVLSSLFSVAAFCMVVASVYLSYKVHGAGGTKVGVLAMGAFIASLVGFIIGVRSFKRDDVFLGFPWFGVVSNAVLGLFLLCMIFIGL